ncbi:MAG: hypothetical protein R3C24_10405 [Cyanobacteriota/Melainabacteria group bacterium]
MEAKKRDDGFKRALADVRSLLADAESDDPSILLTPTLDNEELISLLKANFDRLDPNDDGISRQELLTALSNPQSFSVAEYEMLKLVAKCFDTIINLSDDEPGEEMRLSRMDMEVLSQFLLYSKLTIQELHMWCSLETNP